MTRPVNWVVMRSSATISDDRANRMSERSSSLSPSQSALSGPRSIPKGDHWPRSQSSYSAWGPLSWRSAALKSIRRSGSARQPRPQPFHAVLLGEKVVRPQPAPLGSQDPGVDERPQVLGERGLGHLEQGPALAMAQGI